MAANLGNLSFGITLDNTKLRGDIANVRSQFSSLSRDVSLAGNQITNSWRDVAKGIGAVSGINFGIQGIREFANEVVRMTGTMQGLQLSFETMLQSKSAADKMMSDVMNFALETPYTISETATIVKQLIAMNAAGDDVMATYRALGDVAAGLNVPLQRIAINFGQVAALGKLQAREIRDFAMAGVPIYDALSQSMGKSVQEIQTLVTAGKIGFPETLAAFKMMSDEGGRFANMMSKMNSTVMGQMNRLTDQIEQMFAKIGAENEGLIYGVIGGAATIVSHYKEIIDILEVLITTYGSYWAAQKLVNAVSVAGQGARYSAEIKELEALLLAKRGIQNSDLQQAVTNRQLSAQQAERIAMLRSELVAEEEAAVRRRILAADRLKTSVSITAQELTSIQTRISALRSEATQAALLGNTEVQTAKLKRASALSDQEVVVASKLRRQELQLANAQMKLQAAQTQLATTQNSLYAASTKAAAVSTNILSVAARGLGKAFAALGAFIKANPIGLIIAGITLAIQAVRKLTEAQREANQAHKEAVSAMLEQQAQTNGLVQSLGRVNLSEEERKKILDELKSVNPQIVKGIEDEADAYTELSGRLSDYNELVRARIAVEEFVNDNGGDKLTVKLEKAQGDLEKAEAAILNEYVRFVGEIQRLINDGRLDDAVAAQFDSIISSGLPKAEQIRQLYQKVYLSAFDGITALDSEAFGASRALSEWEQATNKVTRIQGRLNPILDETAQRINDIAGAMEATDDTKSMFTDEAFAKYLPGQLTAVSDAVKTAQTEIAKMGDISEMSLDELRSKLPEIENKFNAVNNAAKPDTQLVSLWENAMNGVKTAIQGIVDAGGANQPYWEDQKKKATEAIELLKQGTAEWNAQYAIIQKADKELAKYGLNGISTSKSSGESRAAKARREAEEAARTERELNDAILEMQRDLEQSRIDLMEDGVEKQKAIRLKQGREELDDLREQMSKIANLRGGKTTQEDFRIYGYNNENRQLLSGLGFSDDEIQVFFDRLISARTAYNRDIAKIDEDALSDLIGKYGSYEQQRADIDKKYAEERKKIVDESGNFLNGMNQENLTRWQNAYDGSVAELQGKFKSTTTAIERLFEDMRKKTSDEMRAIAESANGMLEFVLGGQWDETKANEYGIKSIEIFKQLNEEWSKSPEELDSIRKRIERLFDTSDKSELAFSKIGSSIKRLFTEDLSQDELQKEIAKLQAGFQSLAEMADLFGQSLRNIADMGGSFSGVAESLAGVMDIAGGALSGAASGAAFDPAGAAVGAGLGLISGITGIFAANAKAVAEMKRQAKEAAKEFKQAQEDIADSLRYTKFDNVFGENSAKKAQQAYQELIKTNKSLKQSYDEMGKSQADAAREIARLGIGKAFTNDYKVALDTANGIEADIVAKRKCASDKHTYIQFNPDEFLNSDGTFKDGGLEGLQAWYDQYAEYLDDAEKKTIETFIETGEDAKEAMEILTNYMSELFSDLASNIADSMISSFKETGDAMAGLEDIADSVAENMAKSLIESFILENLFPDDLQKQLMDLLGSGKQQQANNLIQNILSGIEDPNGALAQYFNAVMSAFGIEAGKMERTSAAQGFAQASQDSIDALFGIVTNIENSVWEIKEAKKAQSSAISSITSELIRIRMNTDRLEAIEGYMRTANGTLQNVEDGIAQLNR